MRRYRTNVSYSVTDTVEPSWLMWPWWVKIPTEDFTGETLVIGDTQLREMVLEVVIGVLLLVADEVTDMD